MSWFLRKTSKFIFFLVLCSTNAYAVSWYVYEVVTAEKSFHTSSKLKPDAFLYYNGGEDIIYRLKVLGVYPEKDYEKVLRDYGLEEKNVRYIPHTVMSPTLPRRPYYWWR